MRMTTIGKALVLAMTVSGIAALSATRGVAQQPSAGNVVTAPRPLHDAALILQKQYGKVVTYEEPVLTGALKPRRHEMRLLTY